MRISKKLIISFVLAGLVLAVFMPKISNAGELNDAQRQKMVNIAVKIASYNDRSLLRYSQDHRLYGYRDSMVPNGNKEELQSTRTTWTLNNADAQAVLNALKADVNRKYKGNEAIINKVNSYSIGNLQRSFSKTLTYGADIKGMIAFDCSSLVSYMYKAAFGTKFILTSGEFHSGGNGNFRVISLSEAKPGDVVWHEGHVGIFLGDYDNDGVIEYFEANGFIKNKSSASAEASRQIKEFFINNPTYISLHPAYNSGNAKRPTVKLPTANVRNATAQIHITSKQPSGKEGSSSSWNCALRYIGPVGEGTAMGFSESPGGGNANFTKYPDLTEKQLSGLAYICEKEQGSLKGAAAEASLMANRFEFYGKSFGTGGNGLFNYVKTSTWWADGKERAEMTGKPEYIEVVKKVLVEGMRTVPGYIDEHDFMNDIKSVTNDGIAIDKKSKGDYVQFKTLISNTMGSKYIFYSFPAPGSDPFGYINENRRQSIGEAHYDFDSWNMVNAGSTGDGSYNINTNGSAQGMKDTRIILGSKTIPSSFWPAGYKVDDEELPNSKDFFHKGIPAYGGYSQHVTPYTWLVENASQVLDWFMGFITYALKMEVVGWTSIVENLVSNGLALGTQSLTAIPNVDSSNTASNINNYIFQGLPVATEHKVTVEDVIFNNVPLLDINFFDFDTAAGQKLATDSPLYKIRELVAGWYYTIRTLAILCMLAMLIYNTIRAMVTTVAKERAVIKEKAVDWLIGFLLIFLMHYFMMGLIYINNQAVDVLKTTITSSQQATNTSGSTIAGVMSANRNTGSISHNDEESLYENIRTQAYEVSAVSGWTGTFMYVALVIYLFLFVVMYLKRVFVIAVLTIIAPIVGVLYAFKKGLGLKKWIKDYLYNVIIQLIHAVVYVVLISVALAIAKTSTLMGGVIALILMAFLFTLEKLVKQIFNYDSTTLGGLADTVAGQLTLFTARKKNGWQSWIYKKENGKCRT